TLKPHVSQIYKEKNLGTVLLLRGENIPLYYLGDFFNEKRQHAETDMIAFVFRNAQKPFAILVDDILAQQQVVVKRLSSDMQGMKGVSGTTILGDGKPSLILEPNDLLLRPISRIENNLIKNVNLTNKEEVA
ncbi:MAG: chemotaxis protein CheW, partial [Pseudobdellovibrio sp.]